MTTIPAPTLSPNATAQGKADRASIAQNFDQFLMLLVAQLKNQNPTDPLDTNQFTQQLVSFASVEQQIKSNESLNAMMASMNANNAMGALEFVGKSVTATGTTTNLKSDGANWKLDSDRDGTASVTIKDLSGNVINTFTVTIKKGTQDFKWDGKTATGNNAPAGAYSITVDGVDMSKNKLNVTTTIEGIVDRVDLTKTPPSLVIGATSVSLSAVKAVGSAT